ncbi:MAG TPA: polyprenyl synthetase family protein [Actinomycetes bacterium]|jgi:geranylgeranyl diphosphate synthase type I|nr:polyprenyl synthetase family protein [Actinomycetes bacterium]
MTTMTSRTGSPSQVTEAAQPVPASPLDAEDVRARVDRALGALLDQELSALGFLGPDAGPVTDILTRFAMEGGKRLRPAFVYWGYRGAGGPADGPQADAAIKAACSVELLHVCALVHDDIMDGSEVRRGRPAMHVSFAGLHRRRGWRGDPAGFGEGAALLMGDLAFTWADVALAEAGLTDERLAAALRVFNRLRSELMGGQYLDLVEARRGAPDEDAVRRVLSYKSGRYTIERPLHLGHALAAGAPALAADYSAYGLPLGEAFQLRDDILGVFGEPEVTGKPAGDDLREGKETYLVLLARQRADRAGRQLLEAALGNAKLSVDEVAEVRRLLQACGALEATEARIGELLAEAKAALAATRGIDERARATLAALADHVTDRSA